jgi:hypothetical protein
VNGITLHSRSDLARLRFTRAEAKGEATRLATEFVQSQRNFPPHRWVSTSPSSKASAGAGTSKHPVVWNVMFVPVMPAGTVMDGGELVVAVDLSTRLVAVEPAV